MLDLGMWQPRQFIPADRPLTVLVVDDSADVVWVGWLEDDGTACRGCVRREDIEHDGPRA